VTLRLRVLLGLGLVAVVLVGTAVAVTRTTRSYLVHQVDEQLDRLPRGRFLAIGGRAIAGEPTTVPLPPPEGTRVQLPADEDIRPSPMFLGVITPSGEVDAVFLPNVGDSEGALPELTAEEAIAAAADGAAFTTGSSQGDQRFRVRAVAAEDGSVVVAALPLEDVDAAISRLVAVEVIATVAVLGALGLVAWWVVRLGVRPVNRMAHAATVIAAGDLSHRVPESAPGTEAGELGQALNTMLSRIEAAFDERSRAEQQLRDFLADASHELRTPVTTIRGYAELYRAGGLDDPDRLRDAMRRTEEEAVRMGELVDGMLELARLDRGTTTEPEAVDLSVLARDAARDASAVAPGRTVRVEADEPVLVDGDAHQLRQVVGNLVGNALAHAGPDAAVTIGVSCDGGTATLSVADTGRGMPAAVAARAFERFYVADPSRSREHGGAGLGLSIVAAVVAAHHGDVALDSTPGGGTTVRVQLPARGGEEVPARFTANSQEDLQPR
jgi:two-component system OmpR family sensor kinase